MRWKAKRIVFAGLAAGFAGSGGLAAEREEAPGADADPSVEVLELERERFDRVTVPVSIQGSGPYRFLVDTGAQATSISRDLADELLLNDRDAATLVAMASRTQIETVAIDDFQLGERNMTLLAAPLLEAENIGRADGILGVDSLQNLRVMLDFRDNSIHVADAKELGGNSGYEIVVRARKQLGQLIIADAAIGRTMVAVIIDTGAQESIGNFALRDKLRRTEAGTTQLTDVAGAQVGTEFRIAPTMRIGNIELADVPIAFTDSPAFAELGLDKRPAMVLGMRQLRMFKRVAIDFRKRRVLFDLPTKKFFERGSTLIGNRVAS